MYERYSTTSVYDSPIEERLAFFMDSYLHPFLCWDYIPLAPFPGAIVTRDENGRVKLLSNSRSRPTTLIFGLISLPNPRTENGLALSATGKISTWTSIAII